MVGEWRMFLTRPPNTSSIPPVVDTTVVPLNVTQQCPFTVALPFGIIVFIGGSVSIITNIIIIMAIRISNNLQQNCHLLIGNLAIADGISSSGFVQYGLLVLIGHSCPQQPVTLITCFWLNIPYIVSFNTGSLMVLFVGLDRLLSAMVPIPYRTWTRHRYHCLCALSWLFGLLFLPMAYLNAISQPDTIVPTCVLPTSLSGRPMDIWAQVNLVVCLLTVITYIGLYIRMWRRRRSKSIQSAISFDQSPRSRKSSDESPSPRQNSVFAYESNGELTSGAMQELIELHGHGPKASTKSLPDTRIKKRKLTLRRFTTTVPLSRRSQHCKSQEIERQLLTSTLLVAVCFVCSWFSTMVAIFMVTVFARDRPNLVFHVSLYVGILANINVGSNFWIYWMRSRTFRMAYRKVWLRLTASCIRQPSSAPKVTLTECQLQSKPGQLHAHTSLQAASLSSTRVL